MLRRSLGLIALLPLLSTASCLADAQSPSAAPTGEDPSVWGRPHHPFIAMVCSSDRIDTSQNKSPCGQQPSLLFRDDMGRVRREGFYDGGTPMGSEIDDPQTGLRTIFYLVGKRALVVPAPSPHPLRPGDQWTIESLPARTITGITVPGHRYTRTLHDRDRTGTLVVEEWVSTDLGIVLERDIQNSLAGNSHEVVTALDLAPPDESLFRLPAGYSIQQTPHAAAAAPPVVVPPGSHR